MKSPTPAAVPRHPLRFLAQHRLWIGAGIVFLVITNGLAQSVPLVIKHAIEAIGVAAKAANSDPWLVMRLPLLAAALVIAQTAARIPSRIFIFNAGREAEYELRRSLFGHFCQLDGIFYRKYRTGDLMSRLTNDLSSVRAMFGAGVLHAVNTIFAYAIALPLMMRIDRTLTMWALLPYPILLLGARFFARGIYGRSRLLQQSLARMTSAVQEDLAGIRELKSYRLEGQRSATFSTESADYLKQANGLATWRAGMLPFVGAGAGASLVLVLWIGGLRVLDEQLTLGDLVALNLYVGLLAWPTMAIGWMLSLFQRGIAAWHRLRELLLEASALSAEPVEGMPTASPAPSAMNLEVRQLNLSIGETKVLDNISLKIEHSELLGLVGRVGSGKSTLAEAVARLTAVPDGTIFWGGDDVNQLSVRAVRERISYAPQDAFLFSASIADNIAFGLDKSSDAKTRRAQIALAVKAAGLEPDIAQMPDGLETVVGERGISLSGGQRQRVALARALAAQRPFLILDDSLSSVDAETEREILAGLRDVLTSTTTLLISHRLSALRHADQVVVHNDEGSVAEIGEPSELLQRNGLYAQLYRRQLLDEIEGEH